MIEFFSENNFELLKADAISNWITEVVNDESFELGEISYIFCDDEYLHKMNVQFLNHDTLTDIISFDNTVGKEVGGEVYISIERVRENAKLFKVSFEEELHRVMIHGVLHFCGYQDRSDDDKLDMRAKEDASLLKLSFK